MDVVDASLEKKICARGSMSDDVLCAIGTVLAAAVRWTRWSETNRHWLSVALCLTLASKMLAIAVAEQVRLVRDRAITFRCVIATPFIVMIRHLSRPPQVWAAQ